jgi:hypothetical protein
MEWGSEWAKQRRIRLSPDEIAASPTQIEHKISDAKGDQSGKEGNGKRNFG